MSNSSTRLRDALRYIGANEQYLEAEAAQIEALYSARGRYYHTLDHAIDVAEVAWQIGMTEQFSDIDLKKVVSAALYHDIIYTPGAKDNELRSARYSAESLEVLGVYRDDITYAIMSTTDHVAHTGNRFSEVLIDADLYRFGDSNLVYSQNRSLVMREFGIPEGTEIPKWFAEGRIKFLNKYLNRSPTFYTSMARGLNDSRIITALDNMLRDKAEMKEILNFKPSWRWALYEQ